MEWFRKNPSVPLPAICLLLAVGATGSRAIAHAGSTDKKGPTNPVAICFEAEYANEVTPICHVVRKEGASGGAAFTVPEGAGCRQPARDPGHASYCLHIPEDGIYYTWFRAWWQGTCSNSIFAGLRPGLPRFTIMGNVFNKWHWIHGPMAKLKAGEVEFRLGYREDGVWIDQVLLTTQPDAQPSGEMKANTIPTPPPDRAEMTVSLSANAVACDSLTAPRLRVATHTDQTPSIPTEQSAVLIPGQDTKMTVWLRNNSLDQCSGSVSFLSKSRLTIKPSPTQNYAIAKGQQLLPLDFALSAPLDIERRSHKAILRAVLPSGKVQSLQLNIYCPFKWLCSEPYPLPITGATGSCGIDTPNPIEQAKNPVEVGAWRLAPDNSTTPIGLVDMRKAVCKGDFVAAYACTEVRPPQPGRYLLHTANDDMMKVWVNGEMVHRDDSEQPTSATRALTPIDLVDGPNRILVKICQKRNFWEFLLEIRNSDGSLSAVEGCDMSRRLVAPPEPVAPVRKPIPK